MKWIAAILLLSITCATSADDWPQRRGANQDGISSETDWTWQWPADGPKRIWERQIGGGNGSCAVVGKRLYIIATNGDERDADTVFCLHTDTGEIIWKHDYKRPEREKRTPTRRGASSSTPTVHDGKVYTFSGDAQFYCFDAQTGKVIWQRELMKELGARHAQYDHHGSPVIAGNLVIAPVKLPDASIAAFDRHTGKEAWRAYHKTRDLGGFWSTPVLRTVDGKPCLVYLSGLAVVGLEPKTGKTQWKFDFVEADWPLAWRGAVAASPIVSGDRVFFPFHPDHNRGFSACIEIKNGQPKLLWKSTRLAHWWQDCILWKEHIYGIDQGPRGPESKAGVLYCYELATGKMKWSTDAIGESSRETLTKGGRLLIADGKLIMLNENNSLVIASINEQGCKPLAHARIFRRRGKDWTAPVLASGRLYCRSGRGALVCLDLSKP